MHNKDEELTYNIQFILIQNHYILLLTCCPRWLYGYTGLVNPNITYGRFILLYANCLPSIIGSAWFVLFCKPTGHKNYARLRCLLNSFLDYMCASKEPEKGYKQKFLCFLLRYECGGTKGYLLAPFCRCHQRYIHCKFVKICIKNNYLIIKH